MTGRNSLSTVSIELGQRSLDEGSHSASSSRWQTLAGWLFVPLLMLAVWVPYRHTLRAPFTLDDAYILFQVPALRSLERAWSEAPGRPFGFYTFALNYYVHGHDLWGYHAVNLAIHMAAALALYGLAYRTLRLPSIPDAMRARALSLSAVIACLWALHPLQTQAVTYVVQRFESLMGLLLLACLYCVVRGAMATRGWPWYLAALFTGWLGLATKESMIVLPLVVLAYDRTLMADSWRTVWRRRGWVYAGMVVLVAMAVLRSAWAFDTTQNQSAGFGARSATPWEYLRTQAGVICHYLGLAFWPRQLCIDYKWPIAATWREWLPPGLFIVGLLALTGWALWRAPRLGFLGAAFFLLLAVTSSFMPIDDVAVEHRMYLPLAPVVALAVLAVDAAARRGVASSTGRRMLLGVSAGGVILALGLRTAERNQDYVEPLRLWSKVLEVNPLNDRALTYVGRLERERGHYEAAEAALLRALEVNPKNFNAPAHLGMLKTEEGKFDEAIQWYEQALTLRRSFVKVMILLADLHTAAGRTDVAIDLYRRAIERQPENFEAWRQLGTAAIVADRGSEAIESLRTAIKLNPRDDLASARLAWCLATVSDTSSRDPEEAQANAERLASRTARRDPRVLAILAASQGSLGRWSDAVGSIETAQALAELSDDRQLVERLEQHRACYRAQRLPPFASLVPTRLHGTL